MRWMLPLLLLVELAPSLDAQTLTQQLKSEPIVKLADAVRAQGNPVRGAILFSQQKLGCVNCHAAGNDALLGPDLTRSDAEEVLSDAQFVESLLDPSQRIRKGFETVTVITTDGKSLTGRILKQTPTQLTLRDTTPQRRLHELHVAEIEEMSANRVSSMPEKLADQLQNRQEFLDLVRYVMEIASTGSRPLARPPGGQTVSTELQGFVLLKDLNCGACHELDLATSHVSVKQAPDLSWGDGRLNPRYVARFIARPVHVKPGTTMPDVLASFPETDRNRVSKQITHYLASLTERTFANEPIDTESAERGRALFHSVGCVACHSPRNDEDAELLTDLSVPLGRLGEKYSLAGLIDFLKAPHQVRPSGRMPDLQLTHWEAIDLSHYLSRNRPTAAAEPEFIVDTALAEQGQIEFNRRGCANCHAIEKSSPRSTTPPRSIVRTDRGCLSAEIGAWPRYELNDAQRGALRVALARGNKQLTDEEQIAVTLTAFRCLNCHQRGELGGVSPERDPHFQTTNPNLGPQGRIPPTLTNVGAKLNSEWTRKVLVSGKSIRPYLLTRMPQYGTENVAHLVDLLQRTDELPEVDFATFDDEKAVRTAGFEMAGTGGLNCIACHTFQLKQAATMPAVDLTDMAERLQKTWFYHYMKAPQQLSANTVMPSFWPGGRVLRTDILDGNADLQIEAMWQYLLDGRQARQPQGLIVEPIELLATDEAVMLRRSYPGVGKRGIGVGYPQQVNLVFDAEQLRLAMFWQGKFADPGGVWRSQGHGVVRPLSRDVIRFTSGPDLDDAAAPWIVDEGRPPRHRFRGYRLDAQRRPVFLYEFDELAVSDYFVDLREEDSGSPVLRRVLTCQSAEPTSGLKLRVASGDQILEKGAGEYLIDGKLLVRTEGPMEIKVSKDAPSELFLKFDVPAGAKSISVDYRLSTANSSQ